MKTALNVLPVLLVLLSFRASAEDIPVKATIAIVPTEYHSLFAIKVDRKFKGAVVEVFYANGDLVASGPMEKRKMIINFNDVRPGLYTIRITKNNHIEEFHYQRK